jgi:hypothetical protein
MMSYQESDITVISDPVKVLRQNRQLYVGSPPIGPFLASQLARDIVWLGAFPVAVTRDGSWWIVSSGVDWLVDNNGEVSMAAFHSIIPFPKIGDNCFHAEVLLAAFGDAVVTSGVDGLNWICGEPARRGLPEMIIENEKRQLTAKGRVVAFIVDE